MQYETELAAAVRAAMKKKKLNKNQLAEQLKLSPIMLEKLLCGKIFPAKHLDKGLVEVLGISGERVRKLGERREKKSTAGSAPPKNPEKTAKWAVEAKKTKLTV